MKKSMPRKGMRLSQTHVQGETVGKAWPIELHRALSSTYATSESSWKMRLKAKFILSTFKKIYLFLFKTETFIH